MFDFMCKNKGAISVFLLIVLVPMLTVASIFVDMSRLNLARSVAESSGELALNTALTNYDAVLKDMYGLFATSQDTDELFENLENYYKQCIEAAGVAEADAENYVDQVMQFLRSETGTDDMLNMNLTNFEVTKPTGGSLANPAILKSQIVEFMKYRAPINLGTDIFDAIASLKNVKKQNKLVDKKNKFYEKHTGMMEKLESVWNDLEDYQYRDAYTMYEGDKCTFPDGKYLEEFAERMDECVEGLKTALSYLVRYTYFADSNYDMGVKGVTITVEDNPSDEEYTQIWSIKRDGKTDTYRVEAEPGTTDVNTLWQKLELAYETIQELENLPDDYEVISEGNSISTTEKIKVVSKFNETVASDYHNRILWLIYSLVDLQNALNGCEDDLSDYRVKVNSQSGGNNTITLIEGSNGGDALTTFINDQLAHLNRDDQDGHIKTYEERLARIEQYWDDTHEIVTGARAMVRHHTSDARVYAKTLDSFLEGKIEKLDSAITTLGEIKGELDDENSSYNKALSAWKKSADDLAGDTMGDNDLSEIGKLDKVLSSTKVQSLKARLENAKSSLEDVKSDVGKFKVLGTKWADLASNDDDIVTHNTLKNLLKESHTSDIEGTQKSSRHGTEQVYSTGTWDNTATFDKAYNDVIEDLTATIEHTTITHTWGASEAAKSPNLTKDQRELYTWLYNNFFDEAAVKAKYDIGKQLDSSVDIETEPSANISENKDNADETQKELENQAKEYNENKETPSGTKPERPIDADFLPSGEWGDYLPMLPGNSETGTDSDAMLEDSAGALDSLDGIMDLVGNMATTLRDDLYICNYIMNMFSYSTYEAEIAMANKDEQSAFETWYDWDAGQNKYTLKSSFSNKSNSTQMLKDARTLTKVSINPNANYFYGKEVEYIIYGDNAIAKSYGTIYMIRFALNTVYAFTDAEINNVTTSAATSLFGTPPLTPLIPVAKIAMTIGLALAESAYDLYEMKCGKEIPLYKSKDTWVMKPSSAAKEIVGKIAVEVGEYVVDEGLQALNNALDMTNDELQRKIDEGEVNLEELANSALSATMNEVNNQGNQAIQQIVTICNDIRNEQLQKISKDSSGNIIPSEAGQTPEKIQTAITRLEQWLSQQSSTDSDVVHLAKKTAVDYLTENNGAVIGELMDLLENKDGIDADDLGGLLEEKLDELQLNVEDKISGLTEQAGNALHDLANSATTKLKEAASNGAESLKSAMRDQIGNVFGTSGSSQSSTNNVVSSLLSWAYSDYLQLFLLIGIIASPESILLRTADVIELNMQQIDGNLGYVEVTTETEVSRLWGLIHYTKKETKREANADAFKLSRSYTYLSINATIEVRPMMLTLPILGDTVKSQLTGTNWYEITYEGTMGY